MAVKQHGEYYKNKSDPSLCRTDYLPSAIFLLTAIGYGLTDRTPLNLVFLLIKSGIILVISLFVFRNSCYTVLGSTGAGGI
jgi:hypothetical protein